jgi:hypothetical protein
VKSDKIKMRDFVPVRKAKGGRGLHFLCHPERSEGTRILASPCTGRGRASGAGEGHLGGVASCTYLVKFRPSTVLAEGAMLAVSAVGDAASPHILTLTGTGS